MHTRVIHVHRTHAIKMVFAITSHALFTVNATLDLLDNSVTFQYVIFHFNFEKFFFNNYLFLFVALPDASSTTRKYKLKSSFKTNIRLRKCF